MRWVNRAGLYIAQGQRALYRARKITPTQWRLERRNHDVADLYAFTEFAASPYPSLTVARISAANYDARG
jgi:hypothetical protein